MSISKRVLDLTLLTLFAPLLFPPALAVALAVLVCDGRPIFFRQPRLGREGRPFRIWKFRTMTTEPDEAARRPTRLGAWLRARGLDELPQLIDVLLGRMSLVGPRPLTPADAERLGRDHAAFATRLTCAPGLTGLAQICGARGAALTAAVDAHYARTRTVWLDVVILVRTAFINVVGKRRGRLPLPPGLAGAHIRP